MIQSILLREPSGTWTTSSSAIQSAVESCAGKIRQLPVHKSSLTALQDFSRGLETLKDTAQLLTTRVATYQEVEMGDLDRRALFLLFVKVALTVRNLRSSPFNSADQVFASLYQVTGEVPTLHEAVRCGRLELVEFLLENGAKVNAADKFGFQPLHEAAKHGHKEVAVFLLSRKAKVDSSDIYGWQPIHWAAKHGHKEIVELLLERGAKARASTSDGLQPQHTAALNGHKEITKFLQLAAFNEPLRESYRDMGYLKRILDKKLFPIEQSYINLALINQEEFEKVEGGSNSLHPLSARDALFQNTKRVELSHFFKGNSRLYIEGAAGSGKTTLCRYLVSTWANLSPRERSEKLGPWTNDYETVIFLPLREIRALSITASLRDFVVGRYPGFDFDAIHPDKVLYILDGFDEVASLEELCLTDTTDLRWKIVEFLLRQPHWMMTTRPNLFSERFFRSQRFQNIGFTDENVKAYIKRFCKDFKMESRSLERAILNGQELKDLARIPLYLELVCSLWKENPQSISSLYNFADLYGKITAYLFRLHLERIGVDTTGLILEEIINNRLIVPYRERLEAIAFDSKKSGGNRIGPGIYLSLLKAIPVDERKLFGKHLFEELGFLAPVGDPKELYEQVYSFIHPTFEEYFAARYLLSQLDSSSSATVWVKANCFSKELERLIDFTAALAWSDKQLSAITEGVLTKHQAGDSSWDLPLHRAAQMGLLKLSACLIKSGANVEAASHIGIRPLHVAAWNGSVELVELFVKCGAKVDTVNDYKSQPVHQAARGGHKEVVELLLKKGAKIDAKGDVAGQPLHEAAAGGHKEAAELLLKWGAKVDAVDANGQQPLHWAATHGQAFSFRVLAGTIEESKREVVELLLSKGAKVDAVDRVGRQPVHLAASFGHRDLVELLLSKGAKVDALDKGGRQPLHHAAEKIQRDVVELLLSKGAKVDAIDKLGLQPLHWAAKQLPSICKATEFVVIELLLSKGAQVNATSNRGWQPLHLAVLSGNRDVVELLLKHGAEVDVADINGRYPLHFAAGSGSKAVVELLLKHGAEVNVSDINGRHPIDEAASKQYKDIALLLESWQMDGSRHDRT